MPAVNFKSGILKLMLTAIIIFNTVDLNSQVQVDSVEISLFKKMLDSSYKEIDEENDVMALKKHLSRYFFIENDTYKLVQDTATILVRVPLFGMNSYQSLYDSLRTSGAINYRHINQLLKYLEDKSQRRITSSEINNSELEMKEITWLYAIFSLLVVILSIVCYLLYRLSTTSKEKNKLLEKILDNQKHAKKLDESIALEYEDLKKKILLISGVIFKEENKKNKPIHPIKEKLTPIKTMSKEFEINTYYLDVQNETFFLVKEPSYLTPFMIETIKENPFKATLSFHAKLKPLQGANIRRKILWCVEDGYFDQRWSVMPEYEPGLVVKSNSNGQWELMEKIRWKK